MFCLDLLHGTGRRTLRALLNGKFDAIAFGEGAETIADDGGLVDENVLGTRLRRNEAEALGIVEPLDGAFYAS